MAKYFSSLEDLVGQIISHGADIEKRILYKDPSSCFKMGMKYLLGIDTPIDLNKASEYFENQCISDEPDSIRFLGLIAELNGDYSSAFNHYYNAAGIKDAENYYELVYKERETLKQFLKDLSLPTWPLNNVITNVLQDYIKGGSHNDASTKLALICCNESTCIQVAKEQFDKGRYPTALAWLLRSNTDTNSQMFTEVKNKFEEIKDELIMIKDVQIESIADNSLMADVDLTTAFAKVEKALNTLSSKCLEVWDSKTNVIIRETSKKYKIEKEERKKKEKLEEEARKEQLAKTIFYIVAFLFWFIIFLFAFADAEDMNFFDKIGSSAIGALLFGCLPVYFLTSLFFNKR